MLIDDFNRSIQRIEIETLSELQKKVLPLIYKVNPPCAVNELRMDASERILGIWFTYKSESYVALVEYNYHTKMPYAKVEVYVTRLDSDVPDDFAGNYPKIRDDLELSLDINSSRLYTGIANVELDTPERFAATVEELYQKRIILEKLSRGKNVKDEHLEPLLNSCSGEMLAN